ncbi:MAG: glycosyltransferase [Candidatus Omnitrophica bacterium]|nr:glycosyltransferase [Candidatus Omnitrophota bacterium]
MSPDYLVSCIITTKNRPQFVIRAVKSVIEQSYRNLEIILVDDSDERGTCDDVLRYDKKIKYVKNEKSSGACYSRNLGISESKGDFIAFLDDDDFWMPRKIELQLKEAVRYPLVGCSYISCTEKSIERVLQLGVINYEDMLYYNYLGSCSFVLAQAAAIKKCRFDENRPAAQDWDMWLSIMQKNRIPQAYNVKEYLVSYNQGVHSRITNTAKRDRALWTLYEKHNQEYTPFLKKMFVLYNFTKSDKWGLRGLEKARLKHKGLCFIIYVLFKRLFGEIVMI